MCQLLWGEKIKKLVVMDLTAFAQNYKVIVIIGEALTVFSADDREAYLRGVRYAVAHDPILIERAEVEFLLEQILWEHS